MENPSPNQLMSALRQSWDIDTSSTPDEWSPDNPARGQCVPSSLVVQDFYGGDIARYSVKGENIDESHYFNELDDTDALDATGSQYKVPVEMTPKPLDLDAEGFMSMRDRLVSNAKVNGRYEILRSRVMLKLGERAIVER